MIIQQTLITLLQEYQEASAFSTALHNGNWSNYFRQTNTEAVRAGLNAIKPILKGVIPTITKSILKYMWRDANNE